MLPQDVKILASGSKDTAALIKSEFDLWSGVVKAANMKAE